MEVIIKIKNFLKYHNMNSTYDFLKWIKNVGLKYYSIHRYQQIDGWLSLSEAVALYDLARSLENNNPIVVELGSWQGKSTFILAKGLKEKHLPKIFCIDPFNADGDQGSKIQYKKKASIVEDSLKDQFLLNCEIYKMGRFVDVLEGYSYEFSKTWNKPIDFLFIDADHSEHAVNRDYQEWSEFIVKGGFIAFHDVVFDEKSNRWNGPGKVANLYLGKDKRFVLHKYVDSLLVVKRIT
jgi:predicted O-methyltransferase YrrM